MEAGYRPMIVCSAMGKTTNSLLSAGDFALTGQVFHVYNSYLLLLLSLVKYLQAMLWWLIHAFKVYIDSLRTMHTSTAEALGLPQSTHEQINNLIDELEKLLEGLFWFIHNMRFNLFDDR